MIYTYEHPPTSEERKLCNDQKNNLPNDADLQILAGCPTFYLLFFSYPIRMHPFNSQSYYRFQEEVKYFEEIIPISSRPPHSTYRPKFFFFFFFFFSLSLSLMQALAREKKNEKTDI